MRDSNVAGVLAVATTFMHRRPLNGNHSSSGVDGCKGRAEGGIAAANNENVDQSVVVFRLQISVKA